MNMRELRWNYLRPTDLTGKPYALLRRWIEDLVCALFPDNGIEYWADPDSLNRGSATDLTPKEGKPAWVSSVISTVYHGHNEGRHIDIGLKLRDGTVKQITWAKSFGSGDECWAIARVVAEALEAIFNYEEQPSIVDMYRLLPRESRWIGQVRTPGPVKLPGRVTLERSEESLAVRLHGDQPLDLRKFGGRLDVRLLMMDAYQGDWITLLRAQKLPVTIKVVGEQAAPALPVALLPMA